MDYRINGFAFNRENLAGLDATERAGVSRFLNAREREINTVSTQVAQCAGGPFHGQTIELESGHNCSAPFSVGAWAGSYVVTGDGSAGAIWEGTDGGSALENLQVASCTRNTQHAEKVLGKGFDQLGQLLARMAEAESAVFGQQRASVGAAGEFVAFTIGRTSYRVSNTVESIAALRAKIIKAKRHFSDKLLHMAGTGAPARHTADLDAEAAEILQRAQAGAVATVAAVVATAQALATMAQAEAPAAPAERAELATVCSAADDQAAGAPDLAHGAGRVHQVQDQAPGAGSVHQVHGPAIGARLGHGGPDLPAGRVGAQDDGPAPAECKGVQDDEPAPAPVIAAAAMLGDISAGLARSAYQGTSYSPERRGDSAREEYAATMAEDYAHFYAHAVKGGTLDQLPAEFARYRGRMAGMYRAYLASSSRCVSSFIAGPSNFPARRMNKRADIAHRRLGEYLDGREAGRRAVVRNLRPDLRPIMAGDSDAADRLAVKIAQAERAQSNMKAANLAIRKHAKAGQAHQVAALMELGYSEDLAARMLRPDFAGRIGFPSYELTNNNANIRRMRERLQEIERNQAADVVQAEGRDGVRLEDDPPANRVRLYFPGKPSAEIRATLKAAGFRWSPTAGAWQAYRNYRGMTTARQLAGLVEPSTAASTAPASEAAERVGVQDDEQAPAGREGVQDDEQAAEPAGVQDLDATTAEGYATIAGDAAALDRHQDALDTLYQGRILAVVDQLAARGWPIDGRSWPLGKGDYLVNLVPVRSSSMSNLVGAAYRVTDSDGVRLEIRDDLTRTPQEIAAAIDAAAVPAMALAKREGVQDDDQAPAKREGVQDEKPAPATAAKGKNIRLFVPENGARLAHKAGAWEGWFYLSARGSLSLVFYGGKARKATAHLGFPNTEAGRAGRQRHLAMLAKNAEDVHAYRTSKREALAKPHGLKLGAVLVHSWGYDQTNVDYYQVVELVGRRSVKIRPIGQERIYTASMQGNCVPCVNDFKGDAVLARVAAADQVRVAGHSRGYAVPLEIVGTLPGGAPVYRRHSFSEYA